MQTFGGANADAAILASSRHLKVDVKFDWDNNGLYNSSISDMSRYVSSAVTDRALKGSAPEEILLIEGSSAAQLTLELSGTFNNQSLVAMFSPYNGLSPLYNKNQIGSEVIYKIGIETVLGTVWYQQFVGNVSTVTPVRGDNKVTIVALDRVEKLRAPVLLAQYAIMDYWVSQGATLAQLHETQGIMDAILRTCDVSSTKYRPTTRVEMGVPDPSPDGVLIFIPGNGSFVPSIGWIDNAKAISFPKTETTGTPMYRTNGVPHPLTPEPANRPKAFSAMGTEVGQEMRYWVSDRTITGINGTHFLGFVLNTDTSFPNGSYHTTMADTIVLSQRVGYNRVVRVHMGSNKVWVSFINENNNAVGTGPKLTIPSGQNSVEIFAAFDMTTQTGSRAYLRVDVNTTGWIVLGGGWPGDQPIDQLQGLMILEHCVSMNDVCYAYRNIIPGNGVQDGSTLWRQAKYVACLDDGVNSISFTPQNLNGKESWDVITDLAEAELGSVFWDELGVFHFWNYATVKAKQDSPVRSLTLDQVTDLEMTTTLDSVRNMWSVETSSRVSSNGVIYDLQSIDQIFIPATEFQRRYRLPINNMSFVDPRFLVRYTTSPTGTTAGDNFPQWNQYVTHGFCVQMFTGGVWTDVQFANIVPQVRAWLDGTGYMILEVNNPLNNDIRLANADGSAATMRINGTKITDGDDQTLTSKDAASIARYGQRMYDAQSDWYQTYYNLGNLINTVLPRTSKPIPVTQNITIPGDPRLQLGDVLTLSDPNGFGESMRLQILGINRSFDADDGLTDNLSVELLRPAGVGIWDSSQYGLWDQTFIWS